MLLIAAVANCWWVGVDLVGEGEMFSGRPAQTYFPCRDPRRARAAYRPTSSFSPSHLSLLHHPPHPPPPPPFASSPLPSCVATSPITRHNVLPLFMLHCYHCLTKSHALPFFFFSTTTHHCQSWHVRLPDPDEALPGRVSRLLASVWNAPLKPQSNTSLLLLVGCGGRGTEDGAGCRRRRWQRRRRW